MKITINVNGKATEIELTDEQVAVVKKATVKITDRIKTFEDACEEIGVDKNIDHPFDKMVIIIKALNEGWAPDWNDGSQPKYVPYFKWDGKGFSYDDYDYWYSDTFVGSRLCFKSSEIAIYAGKQFEAEYNEFLGL